MIVFFRLIWQRTKMDKNNLHSNSLKKIFFTLFLYKNWQLYNANIISVSVQWRRAVNNVEFLLKKLYKCWILRTVTCRKNVCNEHCETYAALTASQISLKRPKVKANKLWNLLYVMCIYVKYFKLKLFKENTFLCQYSITI